MGEFIGQAVISKSAPLNAVPYSEVRSPGNHLTITFGKPIPYTTFEKRYSRLEWAWRVMDQVYKLEQDPEQAFHDLIKLTQDIMPRMKEIIPAVPIEALKDELSKDKFIRKTNKAGNKIYIVDAANSPETMKEIGRLREMAFRQAGGGTGKDCDLDAYDLDPEGYKQLVVWDPDEEAILGGYRFMICDEKKCITKDGKPNLATAKLFNFSEPFLQDYVPHMIELGRSFVQPRYQSTQLRRKGLYALDNLWDGLGALVLDNPNKNYMFGKVTMYLHYHQMARDMILFFLNKHFPDTEKLVTPINPLQLVTDPERLSKIFSGANYEEDYKILSKEVRANGENIPPLINAYMSLSPSMRTFGTVMNYDFGEVEETGIMITIDDLYKTKIERHVSNYVPMSLMRIRDINLRKLKIDKLISRFRFHR